MADTQTHLAGLDVGYDRYLRQRCAWCGLTLLDYDLARLGVLVPEDGSEPEPPAMFPIGALVRRLHDGGFDAFAVVDGEPSEHPDGGVKVPDDCCMRIDPEEVTS